MKLFEKMPGTNKMLHVYLCVICNKNKVRVGQKTFIIQELVRARQDKLFQCVGIIFQRVQLNDALGVDPVLFLIIFLVDRLITFFQKQVVPVIVFIHF